jgi:hypothetical protein
MNKKLSFQPALPEIDESDAFTISSFSYYEGSVSPSTFYRLHQLWPHLHPLTLPHLGFCLPNIVFHLLRQGSNPVQSAHFRPLPVDVPNEQVSRESFSFHNSGILTVGLTRSSARHFNIPYRTQSLLLKVWPRMSQRTLGPVRIRALRVCLMGYRRGTSSPLIICLDEEKSVLGIEGGVIQVVVERSASVDSERMV